MGIKYTPGKTLLTLLHLVIYALASLSVFGIHSFAESTIYALQTGTANTEDTDDDTSSQYSDSYALYYEEDINNNKGTRYIYTLYYLIGQQGALGLVDAAGNVILEPQYQDIIVLPKNYILKTDETWGFYDKASLKALNDQRWDSVEADTDEIGKISSNYIKVEKDGLFGATDQNGKIVLSPKWEDLDLHTYAADWPLIKVKKNGAYGYINSSGGIVINPEYDYAQAGVYPRNESDGTTSYHPVIYVVKAGDWGGIFKNSSGNPASPRWDIEPTEEVLADYEDSIN